MNRRNAGWLVGGLLCFGMWMLARPASAAGLEDFKLARAVPSDVTIILHSRGHAGRKFVDEQMTRVWAAIEKQKFENDFKRLLKSAVEPVETAPSGDDAEGAKAKDPAAQFDEHWDKIAGPAGRVKWSELGKRECALALRFGQPMPEVLVLLMPPEDQVAADYEALTAMAKNIAELSEGQVLYAAEGQGDAVMAKLSMKDQMAPVPVALTLARQKDVILVGIGTALVEQSLALLSGQTDAGVKTFITTDRCKEALKRLPAPTDGFYFLDVARLMKEGRGWIDFAAAAAAGPAGEGGEPPQEVKAVRAAVDQIDLWDYVAGTGATEGMKTTAQQVTALRSEAKDRPLYKAFYGQKPLKDALKYVPQDAGSVMVTNGIDFQALYRAITDFIRKEIPEGESALKEWDAKQEELNFNVEKDLLAWVGGGFSSFSVSRGSFNQDWLFMVDVRDDTAATKTIADLTARMSEAAGKQGPMIDDANIEGAEGFKVLVMPPMFAMMGIGQPTFGVKDGRLFVGSNPKVITLALEVGSGKAPNFTKSEKFQKEGLPLPDNATSYQFSDLTKWGEQVSTALGMVGMLPMTMPQIQKEPAVGALLRIVPKLGNVAKQINFWKSTCSVSTFENGVTVTKTVMNYQEPPKPKAPATDEKADDGGKKAESPGGKAEEK
jgi:hypothetical protein